MFSTIYINVAGDKRQRHIIPRRPQGCSWLNWVSSKASIRSNISTRYTKKVGHLSMHTQRNGPTSGAASIPLPALRLQTCSCMKRRKNTCGGPWVKDNGVEGEIWVRILHAAEHHTRGECVARKVRLRFQ